MTTQIMGGLRARLTHDSFLAWLEEGLAALGWFDSGRVHRPISVIAEAVDWDMPIEPNLITVTTGRDGYADVELGSMLTETRTRYLVDLIAENDALGTQVIHDVRDLLRGKFVSIGRGRMVLPVYDFRMATPDVAFMVQIDEVQAGRLDRENPRPWERHWYQATCSLVDVNGGENYGE